MEDEQPGGYQMTEQGLSDLKADYDRSKQQTQYITPTELKERQAEKHRIDLARQQAHEACILLRRDLAQLEMERRFLVEEMDFKVCVDISKSASRDTVPYVFSNRSDYSHYREKRLWSISK